MFTIYNKQTLSTMAVLLAVSSLTASDVVLPTTFVADTTAVASEVNANFTALQTGVNDNNTRLTTAESDIVAATTRVTTAESNITAATTRLTTAESNIAVAETRLTTAESNIAAAETRLTTAESNIAAAETDIATLETTKQNLVSGSCAAGSSIRTIAASGTVRCEVDSDSGGDITDVIAGAGLTGGGSVGSVTIGLPASYISVSHYDLNPALPLTCSYTKASYGGYFNTSSTFTSCDAVVGVALPHGATVTSMTCLLYNNDPATPTNPGVFLMRNNITSETTLAYVIAGGDSGLTQTITDSTINYDVVDNANYAYFLEYAPSNTDAADDDQRFHRCTISYTH